MKKILIIMISVVFIVAVDCYGARLMKIGYVDVEDVFNSYPGTQDIRDKMKSEREKYQVEIDKQKEEIANLEKDFQLNSPQLTDDERQRREAEIDYKKEVLSEYIDDSNKKLNALKDELTKPVYLKIATLIQRICAEKGFSFVFRKGGESLLYVDKDYDLTKDVKDRLMKELNIEERN